MRESVYALVTERIIQQLEAGSIPWVKPWAVSLPYNAVSKRPYSGVNVLLLWHTASERGYKSSAWLTYKQAEELGGHIRKGEKSTLVVYGSSYQKKVETESGEELEERRNFLKQYRLFNVEQAEGLPAEFYEVKGAEPFEDRREEVEAFIGSMGATVKHGGVRAAYNRREDVIKLPPLEAFKDAHGYYYTALHEHGHWTGHESRLNRQFGQRFGDHAYAFEELVAELTSSFVAARLGIKADLQDVSYIGSWLKILKSDNAAIFTAARRAEEAAEYLFTVSQA